MEDTLGKAGDAGQAGLDGQSGQAGRVESAMDPGRHWQPAGAGHENSDMHSLLSSDPCRHVHG